MRVGWLPGAFVVIACAAVCGCTGTGLVGPTEEASSGLTPAVAVASDRGDLQAVVEALFLGTGPMARFDSPGCDASLQRLRGWPRGTHVRLITHGSLDDDRVRAVARTRTRIEEAFGGVLSTSTEHRAHALEPSTVAAGEVAVFAADVRRVPSLCGIAASNCQVVRYTAGAYISSRVVLGTPFTDGSSAAAAHELGHAFGLCHIDPARGGLDPAASVMGHPAVGDWTSLDLDAIRTVYASGLSPGDPRPRFESAGLVR